MARNASQKIYADFRQGWVTTQSPLQQPEGTVKDIVNFDINSNGTLTKRRGLVETGTRSEEKIWYNTASDYRRPSVFLWENVGNDVNKKFLVLGNLLNTYNFFDVSEGTLDFSKPKGYVTTPRIATYTWDADMESRPEYVSALGDLYVASTTHAPLRVTYNNLTGTFSSETITIKVRDTDIWEGPTDADTGLERVTSSSIKHWHYFNLRNAGWPEWSDVAVKTKVDSDQSGSANPITWTKAKVGFYPEISIPFYSARHGAGQTVLLQNAYNPWLVRNNYFGNSTPPVGSFIRSAANFVRGGKWYPYHGSSAKYYEVEYRASELPSSIAFYSGRLWYGDNSYYSDPDVTTNTYSDPTDEKKLSGGARIYFSQIIDKNLDKAGKCYQQNDPTVEDINQLLDTDGGVLFIKEAGNIKKIVALGTALFVFSDKGVWRIAGSDFNSFTPTSYTVDKVSDIEVLSGNLVVAAKNRIYAMTKDALYAVDYKGTVGDIELKDLSTPLIEDYFYTISTDIIKNSTLTYDDSNETLHCYIAGTDSSGNIDPFSVSDILVYKEPLNAFYKYEISTPSNYKFLQALPGLDTAVTPIKDYVVDSSNEIVTVGSEEVYLETSFETKSAVADITLFFMDYDEATNESSIVPATFSDNEDYVDLGDGAYEAFVEIGFDAMGDLLTKAKQVPYIHVYLERVFGRYKSLEEPSEVFAFTLIDTGGV